MVEGWSLNREQLQDGQAGRAVSSELPAVGDDDLALGFPTAGTLALHLPHYVQPLDHAAEHHVLPVQPVGGDRAPSGHSETNSLNTLN